MTGTLLRQQQPNDAVRVDGRKIRLPSSSSTWYGTHIPSGKEGCT